MAEHVEYVVVGLGALGSGTVAALARAGHQVVGLERFALGHDRGASHDTSRILRHSYGTPYYVGLTFRAYHDWAALERASGDQLVTVTGGLDLYPDGAAIPAAGYTDSMAAWDIQFEDLSSADMRRRWPALHVEDGTHGIYQERGAIVPAARGTAAMQREAVKHGAVLRDLSRVKALRDLGAAGVEVVTDDVTYLARRVILCTDGWTNQLLGGLGWELPLTVLQEQVTYFGVADPQLHAADVLPVWMWMDDPSFYGFPCYGEPTIKAGQSCGGAAVTADGRSFEPDEAHAKRLHTFVKGLLPGVTGPLRSKTCLYTLTPDRDFVLSHLPGHEAVIVGLGAAHAFKFAPTFGRLLAELAESGEAFYDVHPLRIDRPALMDPDYTANWLGVTEVQAG